MEEEALAAHHLTALTLTGGLQLMWNIMGLFWNLGTVPEAVSDLVMSSNYYVHWDTKDRCLSEALKGLSVNMVNIVMALALLWTVRRPDTLSFFCILSVFFTKEALLLLFELDHLATAISTSGSVRATISSAIRIWISMYCLRFVSDF